MNDFDYAAPTTVDQAVTMLAERGGKARVLVGGTDLLVQLREGQRQAELVVDIKRIAELSHYEVAAATGLTLGAAVPCHRLYEDAVVADLYPGLADVAKLIGGWQIQHRASIGGNLCNASPAADSIPLLIARNVQCRIVGPQGERWLAATEFCTGPGKNALQPGELLVSLKFAATAPHSACAYLRLIPRSEMDIAVVGVGAWVQLADDTQTFAQARIGLGAVAPTPLFAEQASTWLAGKSVTDETFALAGDMASKIAKPITDKRGTAEYRTHLVGVLVKRALAIACERARS
jgi:carbon-monoxide dehydrogenase medium subunit